MFAIDGADFKKMPNLNEQELRANEEHFLTMLTICNNTYTWMDEGHVYDMSSGKIVPQTWHGWFALTKILSKEFMDAYVEWKGSRSMKFKSFVQDDKKAKEVAKKEAKKAEKEAKLLAANAAAKQRDREAKDAIKKNSSMIQPASITITPEQIAAAEIREKERLKQLELEDKAAKKALRELKNKTKGKKVKHC